MSEGLSRFFKDTYKIAGIAGISIKLSHKDFILIDKDNPDSICGGYFDGKELHVAIGRSIKHWLGIFVHESCHMDQWLESSKYWKQTSGNCYSVFSTYFEYKKDSKKVREAFNRIIRVEADCEKRTIAKIKLYDLPVNVKKYNREANAYLMAYTAMHRMGAIVAAVHKVPFLVENMSTKLMQIEDYSLGMTRAYNSLFDECFT